MVILTLLGRFGRVTEHAWTKNGTAEVDIHYTYDRAGNRTSRRDMVAESLGVSIDETYTYDGLNQLTQLQLANADMEKFTYDAAGNWTKYVNNVVVQTRTHNAANEIVSIDDKKPVVNDKNGNMTRLPKPENLGENFDLTYDAWNRLVKVKDVAEYSYDGLNRRNKKTTNGETRVLYYNDDWQCLEERVNGAMGITYVWGLHYIDDLVYWKNADETFYIIQDANWNVVALANTSGSIVERYNYNAFGRRNVFDASFNVKSTSSYPSFTCTFTGQVLDAETGLMLYRNRVYHPTLGRFIQRDSTGYDGEDLNLYRYVTNASVNWLDFTGNKCIGCSPFESCVMGCEEDCHRRFIGKGTWNPFRWRDFIGCTAGCKPGCKNEDFTLCSYFRSWTKCDEARFTCLGALMEMLDTGVGLVPGATVPSFLIGMVDCAFDVLTAIQLACQNKGSLTVAMIAAGDCFGTVYIKDKMGAFYTNMMAMGLEDIFVEKQTGIDSVESCKYYMCHCS